MSMISIIIPTYNRSKFICQAIDSVLAQTHQFSYEIIVVDDGSNDNTYEKLKLYGDQIIYIKQNNNGPGAARNRGIIEAKGEYIAFLDSDDIWVPRKLEIQLDFFRRYPYLDLVFGDINNFYTSRIDNMPEIKNREIHNYLIVNAKHIHGILECLVSQNIIFTSDVVLKRSCFERIGMFDESLRIGEDYDLWLRAACDCRFGFINSVLAKRRRHEGNLVNDWVRLTSSTLQVLKKFEQNHTNLSKNTARLLSAKMLDLHYDLGSYFLKQLDFSSAYSHLKTGVPGRLVKGKWILKLLTAYLCQLGLEGNSKRIVF